MEGSDVVRGEGLLASLQFLQQLRTHLTRLHGEGAEREAEEWRGGRKRREEEEGGRGGQDKRGDERGG